MHNRACASTYSRLTLPPVLSLAGQPLLPSLLLCRYLCPQSSERPSDLGCAWIAPQIHHTRIRNQVMRIARNSQPSFPLPVYSEMGRTASVGTPNIGTSNILFVLDPEGTA